MIEKISYYKSYEEVNPKFDINIYNRVPLYKWIDKSDEYRNCLSMYYLNATSDKRITYNYDYSVGSIKLIQFLTPKSSWKTDEFHIMHDSIDDDHTCRILGIPIIYHDDIKIELFAFLHSPEIYLDINKKFLGKIPTLNEKDMGHCLFYKFGDIIITKYNISEKVVIDH